MKEKKKRFLVRKADYWNRDDFVRSLRRLRQSGGPKQAAAEKALAIIGNFAVGAEAMFKLTNNGLIAARTVCGTRYGAVRFGGYAPRKI